MKKCSQVKYSENSEPPTGVEPITFQIPVRRSNHWAIGDLWWARSSTTNVGSYMCDMCPAILQGSTCRNDKCE